MGSSYNTFPDLKFSSLTSPSEAHLESQTGVAVRANRRLSRRRCGIRIIVTFAVSIAAIYFLFYWRGEIGHTDTSEPISGAPESNETCHWCIIDVPEAQKEWPAVGYDLTESYGAATIIFRSGEVVNIGPIEGDKAYKDAMHKLSLESSKHTAPPYDWYRDPPGGPIAGLYDIPRRRWRSLRKMLGLAASPEVGSIAGLLKLLAAEADSAIQLRNPAQNGRKAVITSPDLLALYDEDIYDVAEYAGLNASGTFPWETSYFPESLLSTLTFQRQPKYADAAFMGYGLGLCKHPEHEGMCKGEERDMPWRYTMVVYVSSVAIDVECPPERSAASTRTLQWQQHSSYFDDSLGLGDNEDEGYRYWLKVHALLEDCMARFGIWRNVTDVLLIGEKAGDDRVEAEVRKAVMQRPQKYKPRVFKAHDPIFVPSKGAAEMAARILWTPEGCGIDTPAEGRRTCLQGLDAKG